MPEKTAESFRDDGFFITGDMAVRDEDGYVSIVGRDKDLIISGGLNVYPKEVEGLVDDVEGVLESAVIGVPHRDFGEAVVAVVVREDPSLEAATIETALAEKIARFKRPRLVRFVDDLPKTPVGKIQKVVLREEYWKDREQIFGSLDDVAAPLRLAVEWQHHHQGERRQWDQQALSLHTDSPPAATIRSRTASSRLSVCSSGCAAMWAKRLKISI